jgi:hypothetical protein
LPEPDYRLDSAVGVWETRDVYGTSASRYATWVYRGVVAGLLVGIAYDTSAQAAMRNPLGFGAVLLGGLGGAVVGVFITAFIGVPRAPDHPPDP